MERPVFISYASENRHLAELVCRAIEAKGVARWIAPRDIAGGTVYAKEIITVIDAARVFVLVFSSAADASPFVLREVDRAVGRNSSIVPLRIENVQPSDQMAFYLGVVQWLDAFDGRLPAALESLRQSHQNHRGGFKHGCASGRTWWHVAPATSRLVARAASHGAVAAISCFDAIAPIGELAARHRRPSASDQAGGFPDRPLDATAAEVRKLADDTPLRTADLHEILRTAIAYGNALYEEGDYASIVTLHLHTARGLLAALPDHRHFAIARAELAPFREARAPASAQEQGTLAWKIYEAFLRILKQDET